MSLGRCSFSHLSLKIGHSSLKIHNQKTCSYTLRSEITRPYLRPPQNKRENLWGVSRDQRAQGPEVARLAAEIPNSAWVKCDSDETSCLDSALDQERPQATIPNTALEPSLCGKMIFGLGVPTPWSYRNLVEDKNRLTRASYVEVVCQ